MFDDLTPKKQDDGSMEPIEDIFSGPDPVKEQKIPKPPVFQPKAPISIPENAPIKPGSNKKYFILGLGLLIFLFLGFFVFSRIEKKITETPVDQMNQTDQSVEESQPAEVKTDPEQSVAAPSVDLIEEVPVSSQASTPAVDSDQDGLSDDEEISIYKTDPNNSDTDDDGLFDREEVKVYKTDPLKKDSDGDSFTDGSEVKNGYNPNGPGKLYEIK